MGLGRSWDARKGVSGEPQVACLWFAPFAASISQSFTPISGVLVSPPEAIFEDSEFLWSVQLDSTVRGELMSAYAPLLSLSPFPR